METRSDNFKKVPVGPRTKKLSEETRIRRKVAAANLERQAVSVSRKKEIPPLTPLHRLQKFKVIRDRNLKSKGFKTSLENKIKKMEGVTTATTNTVEVKEKITVKETIEEVVISNTNGIEKLDKNVKEPENKHDESNSSSKEENQLSSRLKEVVSEDITSKENELEEEIDLKSKISETSDKTEPIQDSNIESNTENEETNKIYSASLSDDAVSSVSSQQANNNSTPGPTDDEDEVEVIESKPEYESTSKDNKSSPTNEADKEETNDISCRSSKDSVASFSKGLMNVSASSSYKSSYSNSSRIYGRRPVRCFTRSRKRKMEEETLQNYDFKRTNSPSQPSPRWKFFPSNINFWTPRTTPSIFPSTTPVKALNDSMMVNIDEDTIRNNLDDSDLFSDADDFTHQPAKKFRWGCAIM